jgi:hypothetical protein
MCAQPPTPVRPRLRPLLAALAAASAAMRPAGAQFPRDSALYNQSLGAARDGLTTALRNAPLLEDVYYPTKYRLPTDFYVGSSAAASGAYVQNVVFDPCRQWGAGCCNDTFGSPEFVATVAAPGAVASAAGVGQAALAGGGGSSAGEELPRAGALRDDGSPLATEASRRPDDELRVDPRCTGEGGRAGRMGGDGTGGREGRGIKGKRVSEGVGRSAQPGE